MSSCPWCFGGDRLPSRSVCSVAEEESILDRFKKKEQHGATARLGTDGLCPLARTPALLAYSSAHGYSISVKKKTTRSMRASSSWLTIAGSLHP
jgi:hypothetical protein